MSEILLSFPKSKSINGLVSITGSKSEANRLQIINRLYDNVLTIKNMSNSEDSQLLGKALVNSSDMIDIHHAGTAMRFLTACFSIREGKEITLTGSSRMKERPIGILVDALQSLGAEINYLENEGYPPLKITGKKIIKDEVELPANVSSQFITALMLIAPKLENGLKITLIGKITSLPYIQMSLGLMKKVGFDAVLDGQVIRIKPKADILPIEIAVESDWSSASYYYSLAAMSEEAKIELSTYYEDSLQGDSDLKNIYAKYFGVDSKFDNGKLILEKNKNFRNRESSITIDLNHTPDIAQTIAVTCLGLKQKCLLTGLETLKIKETDRLTALQNELRKCGAEVEITHDTLSITRFEPVTEIPVIATYNDHRMAMCFAPFALLKKLKVENPEVVGKSYPGFWEDFKELGFDVQ